MSEGRRRPYAEARRIALGFIDLLRPACHRIEVAGSLRRELDQVGDLEIVAIPRVESREVADPRTPAQSHLFAATPAVKSEDVNLVWEAIEAQRDRIRPIAHGTAEPIDDPLWSRKRLAGSKYLKLYLPRVSMKVDLFLPSPETWGAVFAIRTGSADFSKALVQRWTAASGGGHVREGRLCGPADPEGVEPAPLSTPEERDVFAACGLQWVEPRERYGASAIRPLAGRA